MRWAESAATGLWPGAALNRTRRVRACVWLSALALVLAGGALAPSARADGDPGSDVLVYQPLFLEADANVPVAQQVALGGLLASAAKAKFPIRVAIIASPSDLGAITELWRQPRQYARFLGLELSLGYSGRLLVVMPNGFGFHWLGHSSTPAYHVLGGIPIRPGGAGLVAAAQAAVRALAHAQGVRLSTTAAGAPASPTQSASPASGSSPAHRSGSNLELVIFGLVVLAALGLAGRLAYRRGLRRRTALVVNRLRRRPGVGRMRAISLSAGLLSLVALALIAWAASEQGAPNERAALANNPALDPGTSMHGRAPDFTLTDQLGQPVSLHAFRGRVVILAFNDSECTTVCPLTTTAMLNAKAMLGAAGSRVQLLGVDANPKATAVADVLSYSQLHGLLDAWQFLTGPLASLQRVWKAYSIGVQVNQRTIDHTPAVFVIDPNGQLAKLYVTQPSYAAVGQFAQILANEAASLLPDHPAVNSHLSYQPIAGTSPAATTTLPRAGGGMVPIGPHGAARLYVFFATWDQEITSLAGQLQALGAYQRESAASALPRLTAVDEASVEPPGALERFLHSMPRPLAYPVALDQTGRLADGYEVQGQPWFVLVGPGGHILWYWQVATSGWLTTRGLTRQVRNALARVPQPASATAAQQQLAGSPAPLASLHQQASRLLGSASSLKARIRALRGYPIVVNIWASWCPPCRAEFSLFAAASTRYGRRVAFLGADTDDSAGNAQAFLAQHPVSYPSYPTTTSDLRSLAIVEGLPTTVFINPAGKVVYVHTGQYDAQGTLDGDVATYATGGP